MTAGWRGAGKQPASQDDWHTGVGNSPTPLLLYGPTAQAKKPLAFFPQRAKMPTLRMTQSNLGDCLGLLEAHVSAIITTGGDGWLRVCLCYWTTSKSESVLTRHR